jgi:hypothetical protein
MFSFTLVIAVTAFLAGTAAALFAVVVIGIRRNDRPRCQAVPRNAPLDSFTRVMLGTRTWPNEFVAPDGREDA